MVRIAVTGVYVHDVDEAFRIYTEVLGFVERIRIPHVRLAIVVSPEEPQGTGLLLEPADNPIAKAYQEAMFAASMPVIVFHTDDIHTEYRRLGELGVVFRGEPERNDFGLMVPFEDGCGNLIHLVQTDLNIEASV